MANKKGHILFVSHLANRSGAPILFLEIIKAFSKQTSIPFSILSVEDGELIEDFRVLGKTFVWKRKPLLSKNYLVAKAFIIYNRVMQLLHGMFIIRKIKNTSLVFYNTVVNEHIHKKLAFMPCKTICYVHELEAAIHMLTSEKGRKFIFTHTNLFLSVSEAVKNNLVIKHNISSNIVKVIASPVNETYRDKKQYADFMLQFLQKYQTGGAVIIGIVGTNEWRKGFDLLIPLVTLYFQLFPNANTYFVWKGFRNDQHNSFFDFFDYERCKYKNRILLLPHDKESIAQMACFDIHLLLSREDPYPLVVLEAASFGIPTVCFADAGGTPEFIEDDCGFVVPYANLTIMAESLHALVEDTELRKEMGFNCRQKLKIRHDKEKSLKAITEIIIHNSGALN